MPLSVPATKKAGVHSAFLSSTFADFERERERLQTLIPFVDVHVFCADRTGATRKSLSETLTDLIDRSDMIILLLGSRSGTPSDTGEPWTEKEVRYALSKKKPVFAYLRITPPEYITLTDTDGAAAAKLQQFIQHVRSEVRVVPQFRIHECCKLVACVIRDVDRYARQLDDDDQQASYHRSFEG